MESEDIINTATNELSSEFDKDDLFISDEIDSQTISDSSINSISY